MLPIQTVHLCNWCAMGSKLKYRVIQTESSIYWEVTTPEIVRKKSLNERASNSEQLPRYGHLNLQIKSILKGNKKRKNYLLLI